MLEVFVETILSSACSCQNKSGQVFGLTLYTVANECWTPTSEDTSEAFSSPDLAPTIKISFVESRIDLSPAFYEIKRCDKCVCRSLDLSALEKDS